jgi:NAD(P)-dependent dehydrogenase (short-subunit alcohol dehydrogenase family)
MTEAIRLEIGNQGINVITLAPGDYATDIASRRFHAPVIINSPYQKAYQGSLDTMDSHIDSGNDPIEIAHKVAVLIEQANPRPHYVEGSFIQKFSLTLKKILPQKAYEKLLKNHYKL